MSSEENEFPNVIDHLRDYILEMADDPNGSPEDTEKVLDEFKRAVDVLERAGEREG